ncbi:MAG: hypothetical protein QM765_04120 [Myxococcales bacterium]
MFTELRADQAHLAAEAVFDSAREELSQKGNKKTKTIVTGESLNRVPFSAWTGYLKGAQGGLYVGDSKKVQLWKLPETLNRAWDKAHG